MCRLVDGRAEQLPGFGRLKICPTSTSKVFAGLKNFTE
jgi:hypothetical protein